jgi:hypothetical protein
VAEKSYKDAFLMYQDLSYWGNHKMLRDKASVFFIVSLIFLDTMKDTINEKARLIEVCFGCVSYWFYLLGGG